jgi:hypothetical protein
MFSLYGWQHKINMNMMIYEWVTINVLILSTLITAVAAIISVFFADCFRIQRVASVISQIGVGIIFLCCFLTIIMATVKFNINVYNEVVGMRNTTNMVERVK